MCGYISMQLEGGRKGVLCEAKAWSRLLKRLVGKVEWLLCAKVDIVQV